MLPEIVALFEGSYSVDITKKFIPFDPKLHKKADRPASLFVHVQPFLIKTKSELLVLDTGLGYLDHTGEMIIHQNIKKAGYHPDDVTKVLMSHLHFDHSGGMIQNNNHSLSLSFSNAEYIIQEGEWQNAYTSNSGSYNKKILDVLMRSGQVKFVNGSGNLTDEIYYEVTGGHCEFHQVFHVKTNDNYYFFGGDILPEPEQLLKKFIAKYDSDGRKALDLRLEYGKKAALENWICLYYHSDNLPISKVSENANGFNIVSI